MVERRSTALAALRAGHGLAAAPELLLPRGLLRSQPAAAEAAASAAGAASAAAP
jgi:hypothetical protein